jgi:hypothetical protein
LPADIRLVGFPDLAWVRQLRAPIGGQLLVPVIKPAGMDGNPHELFAECRSKPEKVRELIFETLNLGFVVPVSEVILVLVSVDFSVVCRNVLEAVDA